MVVRRRGTWKIGRGEEALDVGETKRQRPGRGFLQRHERGIGATGQKLGANVEVAPVAVCEFCSDGGRHRRKRRRRRDCGEQGRGFDLLAAL